MKLAFVWYMVSNSGHKKVITEIDVTKSGKRYLPAEEQLPGSDDFHVLKRKVVLEAELGKVLGKADAVTYTANFYGFCLPEDLTKLISDINQSFNNEMQMMFDNVDKMWNIMRKYF